MEALYPVSYPEFYYVDGPGFLKPLVLAVLSFDHKSFKSSASFGKFNILYIDKSKRLLSMLNDKTLSMMLGYLISQMNEAERDLKLL
ncbi:hypothetical protein Tco_1005262 [Tanacetum coccineum]|uniref:Uncharacterized protein n=1 Tax=Tanacetum coccineum TaxID=301880 RepID=A0ABQ5FFF5_9ASTR